jgi:hypothetical protein
MSAEGLSHERSDSSAGLLVPPYTILGNVLALKFEFTFEFASEFTLEGVLEGSRIGGTVVLEVRTASVGIDRSSIIRSRMGVSPLSVGRGPRLGRVIIFTGQRIGIVHSTASRRA